MKLIIAEKPSLARNIVAGIGEMSKRNGFFENEVEYFQPSYRKGGDSVPLILMTTGAPLDNPKPLIDEIYKTVYFI